jgi:plastocyanin
MKFLKNKKIILTVGIALFAAIFYFLNSGETLIIEIGDSGFKPGNITIDQGDTVIFINTGSYDHWPASNIHPTHSIYPEFDPKDSFAPGRNWSFKFTKAGSWRFHDHLYPQFTGTVTVNDKDNALNKITEHLNTLPEKISGLFSGGTDASFEGRDMKAIIADKDTLNSFLRKFGIKEAMDRLVQESGGGSTFDCHQEAHTIGRLGFEVEGEEAFPSCDASCHSGCYHGAMESFLNKEGTTDLADNIDRICQKFGTSFGIFECLHGVGHGVLAYLDYDLPGALKQCGGLSNSFAQSSCYGGLFMENILTGQGLGASEKGHITNWVNRTDPYYPCDKIDQASDIQYQCWQMQTSWMLTMAGYNFDTVIKQCLKAPVGFIPVCFKSLGRDIAGHTLRNPEKIASLCAKVEGRYYDDCMTGALNVIVDFWGPALKDQASQLCRLLKEPHKETCYHTLSGRIGQLTNDPKERLTLCNTMEEPYRDFCAKIN